MVQTSSSLIWCSTSVSRLTESTNIEFRTEIFNIFNFANFAVPSTTLNNALPTITLRAFFHPEVLQPGSGFTQVAGGGAFRSLATNSRTHGWTGNESSDPVCIATEFLASRCSNDRSAIKYRINMSLQEMTHRANNLIPTAEDIYDDGFLRVEHKNYYVACGGSPIKLPRTEFLIFSRLTRTPNRIVTADELWSSVWGGEQAAQLREPARLHLSPARKARRFRTANRDDGQRRLPADHLEKLIKHAYPRTVN